MIFPKRTLRIGPILMLLLLLACEKTNTEQMETHTMAKEQSDAVAPMVKIFNNQTGQTEQVPKIVKNESQWQKQLGREVYRITREKGTERAFTGEYYHHKGKGVYQCVACGTDLYSSDAKFESGTGWPSFYQAVAEGNIQTEVDASLNMIRTEVMCGRCGAHLGHIFDDGPPPTGMRHCINSASLKFVATGD